MLDKLKRKAAAKTLGISEQQIAEMEAMQREIAAEQYRHEENGIIVKVSGDMKVQYLVIDGSEREDVKKAINKAMEQVQKEVQKKMMGAMGGGLGGLMGGRR